MAPGVPYIIRPHLTAIRVLLAMTAVLGLAYPLAITGIGQLFFSDKANGSLVRQDGAVVGSSLLGQNFTDSAGAPLPQWFQPRPSAAGDGYDPTASGASNLGPNNPVLIQAIKDRLAEVAHFDGVSTKAVPPDAVTASGSGLDPDISVQYAYLQVNRVAAARDLDAGGVRALVSDHIVGRDLGFIGAEHVNVLQLNLALAALSS